MKLLFDESGSETNNNFHDGLNVTVRRGDKYLKIFDIDTKFVSENLQGKHLGYGSVVSLVGCKIKDIPEKFLELEHDPHCRTREGLIEVLQNVYHDKSIDENELVTVVVFRHFGRLANQE